MTLDAPTCRFCGEPEELSLFEIWEDGNFQLSTCCLWLLEHISAEIDADPRWGCDLLRHLGAEDLTGHRLRRVSDGQGNGPVLDWQLRVRNVSFPVARAFIDKHHRHVGAPHAWRFGASIWNGHALMGVFYGVVLSTHSKQCPRAFVHESPTYGVIPVDSSVASLMRRMVCRLVLNSRAKADTPAPSSSRRVTLPR